MMIRRSFLKLAALCFVIPALDWTRPTRVTVAEYVADWTRETHAFVMRLENVDGEWQTTVESMT